MKKIDTTGWEKFELSSLFDVVLSKGDIQAQLTPEGDIPLISSGKFNNGVCKHISEGDGKAQIFEGNVITTDMFGKSFYQSEKFYAVSHGRVNILLPKFTMSKNTATFIVGVMDVLFSLKYSFSGMCNQKALQKEHLFLPKNSDGNPDFVYMENYMKRILDKTKKRLNKQLEINQEKKTLSSKDWCDFQVGNLFKKVELKIKKGSFDKKFDVSEVKTEEFNLPLVNAKHFNNGIMYYGRKSDFEYENMTLDVVQNGAIATGDVYVQPQDTGVLWDAYLLKPLFDTNEHVLRFIATSLRKTLKEKYGYDDKCTWEKVKMEFIKLPAVSADTPNFAYMENYMKNILAKQRANLEILQTL